MPDLPASPGPPYARDARDAIRAAQLRLCDVMYRLATGRALADGRSLVTPADVAAVAADAFREAAPDTGGEGRESPAPQPLARELAAFDRLRPDLVAEFEGRWAVVGDDNLIGVRDSFESAIALGYEARGLAPFLVKEVLTVDRVHHL